VPADGHRGVNRSRFTPFLWGGRMTAEFVNRAIRAKHSGAVRGFTIVELVVIISIVGLMAAVIAPRFAGRDAFASRGFYDQAITTVRMAQKIAIAERASATPPKTLIFVVVDANSNSIRVCRTAGCSAGTEVINPATGAALAVSAPSGVTLSSVTFSFNGLGQPQPSAGTTISIGGDPARQIIVTAETGYVTRP
jgi:MSHA pilin protein MshC